MCKCPICNGDLSFLGKLGKLLWFRCINCGSEISQEEGEINFAEDD